MRWTLPAFITFLKLLLIPAYRSTDFEVHRNWLAITSSQPISKWYYEKLSQWTLDYPPLFAWFEFLLSLPAQLFDSDMLKVENLDYESNRTIIFQRLSVIISDFVLIYATNSCSGLFLNSKRGQVILPFLIIACPGLLMIDHIHFQYNGIMYGILLLSITNIMRENLLRGAFWFTVLLNTKHIYMYVAPAYFVYLLKHQCLTDRKISKISDIFKSVAIKNTAKLAGVVSIVFLVSFGPFINFSGQVLSQLFPFKRGLCHAYWAPNFWALYNMGDKFSTLISSKIGISLNHTSASMTGGLVQQFSHTVLPNITPILTMVLTAIFMLPALFKLFNSPKQSFNFVRCIVLCAFSAFIFGWHVHEKAILMVILPMSIVAVTHPGDAKSFLLISTVGSVSLFPLLFPPNLFFIKLLLVLIYSTYAFHSLNSLYPFQFCDYALPLLNIGESIYLLGFLPLMLYTEILHHLLPFLGHLPFLPLLVTSVYCAVGVCYCFVKYYMYFLFKCK